MASFDRIEGRRDGRLEDAASTCSGPSDLLVQASGIHSGAVRGSDLACDATAEFLLTRGDYAWLGYSWSGCETFHAANATWLRPRPALWDADFGGAPARPCAETAVGSGVFTRAYPRADVSWDCAAGRGEIAWRG